jgi:hypothetical protein
MENRSEPGLQLSRLKPQVTARCDSPKSLDLGAAEMPLVDMNNNSYFIAGLYPRLTVH